MNVSPFKEKDKKAVLSDREGTTIRHYCIVTQHPYQAQKLCRLALPTEPGQG